MSNPTISEYLDILARHHELKLIVEAVEGDGKDLEENPTVSEYLAILGELHSLEVVVNVVEHGA